MKSASPGSARMTIISDLTALIISGLASGSAYALLALGIVIIFRSTDTVNFALGHTGVLAVFCSTVLLPLKLPAIVLIAVTVLFGGLLGVVTERALIKPIGHRKHFIFIALVITIGLSLLIHAMIGAVWGHQSRPFPPLVAGTMQIGSFAVSFNKISATLAALVTMTLVAIFFGRTALGTAMRASAEDPFAARLVGLNANSIAMLAWFMGCALATLGMYFLAADLSLSATLADNPLFRAFAGVFLGGLTSMPGAVFGGFVIGILDNLASAYVSPNFRDTIVFTVILLVLFIRPAGILGALRRERV